MNTLARVAVLVAGLLIAGPRIASAQLSSQGGTTTGSSCSGGCDTSGCCSVSRANSGAVTGTSFTSRYAWNINADVSAGSTRDTSSSAQHNVTFNATAPGGYQLGVATTRVGMVQRNSDVVNCDGSASTSGITGTSNVGFSGSLSAGGSLTVSNGTGDNQQGLNQGPSAAQIFRISNGVTLGHTLTFTWNGSVRSNSCEAAVRLGEGAGGTSGCGACEYPGTPSRTQSSDGHFVTVTFTSLCGNGTVDASVSEQCDTGIAGSACCDSNCRFSANTTVCRALNGTCDVAESCTGTSAGCPTNAFVGTTQICRAQNGTCDVAERCTGSGTVCPVDGFASTTLICRGLGDVCDVAEHCTGSGTACPADGFASTTTVCRGTAGECDVAEQCTGGGAACPADDKATSGTPCSSDGNACTLDECDGLSNACQHPAGNTGASCRSAATVCDVAETCDGASTACPTDGFASSTVECRGTAGECDVAETCPGSSTNCPADTVVGASTPCTADANPCTVDECDGVSAACQHPAGNPGASCRASGGFCDVAETCDGSSTVCPADAFAPSTVECRSLAGSCDLAESCTGTSAACPPDSVSGAFTPCRAAAGPCDVPEVCDGVAPTCPADALRSSTFTCRGAAGVCDAAESCSGTSVACPTDAKSTAVCRGAASTCDVAESCDGLTNNCPVDLFALIGTPCRAAAGSCDLAEVCTGLSATCPTNGFVPDTTPCNDANTCTTSDACLGGACVGTPDPTNCVDHFLCYKTRQPSFAGATATLDDSFDGSVSATVKRTRYLCTPAANNGGPVLDNVTHLKAYKFRETPTHVRETNLLVTNDTFGSIRLDTTRPDLLYVPAAKSLVSQPLPPNNNAHNVDHYKCYKVRVTRGTPKFPRGQTASVGDQFTGPKSFNVKKPRHLCTPVDKNGESIKTPAGHLLCYKVSVVRGQPKHTGQNTFVTDQFTGTQMLTRKEAELCIPSLVAP